MIKTPLLENASFALACSVVAVSVAYELARTLDEGHLLWLILISNLAWLALYLISQKQRRNFSSSVVQIVSRCESAVDVADGTSSLTSSHLSTAKIISRLSAAVDLLVRANQDLRTFVPHPHPLSKAPSLSISASPSPGSSPPRKRRFGVGTTTAGVAPSPVQQSALQPVDKSPSPKQCVNREVLAALPPVIGAGSLPRGTFHTSAWSCGVESALARDGTVMVMTIESLEDGSGTVTDLNSVQHICEVLGHAITIVAQCGGVVHQFDLSTIVATFDVQRPCEDANMLAIDSAIEIATCARAELKDMRWGVGLACGSLLCGDAGTSDMRAFVVSGRPLEMARNLSKLNYILGTCILCDERLHDRVQEHVVSLLVDFVADRSVSPSLRSTPKARHSQSPGGIVGRPVTRETVAVFQIIGEQGASGTHAVPPQALVKYLDSIALLRRGHVGEALHKLREIGDDCIAAEPQFRRYLLSLEYHVTHRATLPVPYYRATHELWDLEQDAPVAASSNTPAVSLPYSPRRTVTWKSHESPTKILAAIRATSMSVSRADGAGSPRMGVPVNGGMPSPLTPAALEGIEDAQRTPLSPDDTRGVAKCVLDGVTDFTDVTGRVYRRSSKMIGSGAFGEVYLGMSPDDGRLIAMKSLRIPFLDQWPAELLENVGQPTEASPTTKMKAMRRRRNAETEKLQQLVAEIRMLYATAGTANLCSVPFIAPSAHTRSVNGDELRLNYE